MKLYYFYMSIFFFHILSHAPVLLRIKKKLLWIRCFWWNKKCSILKAKNCHYKFISNILITTYKNFLSKVNATIQGKISGIKNKNYQIYIFADAQLISHVDNF